MKQVRFFRGADQPTRQCARLDPSALVELTKLGDRLPGYAPSHAKGQLLRISGQASQEGGDGRKPSRRAWPWRAGSSRGSWFAARTVRASRSPRGTAGRLVIALQWRLGSARRTKMFHQL